MDEESIYNIIQFLHDRLYIIFHGLLEFVSSPPPRGRLDANYSRPYQWCNVWMRSKYARNFMVMEGTYSFMEPQYMHFR